MHTTVQTRLTLDCHEAKLIDELLAIVGRARRAASRKIWIEKHSDSKIGSWIREEFGIHARQADGIRFDLARMKKSWRERVVVMMQNAGRRIAYNQRLVHENLQALAEARNDHLTTKKNHAKSQARIATLKRALFRHRCGLDEETRRLERLKAELQLDTPRVCFGGASLAREGARAGQSGSRFPSHEEFKQCWQDARDSYVLIVGSGAEPFGNIACRFDPASKTLLISLARAQQERRIAEMKSAYSNPPNRLPGIVEAKRLIIQGVTLPPKHRALHEAALANGQPMLMKIVRRRTKSGQFSYYLHVGFEIDEAPVVDGSGGAIGMEFDAKQCAWIKIKDDGNPLPQSVSPSRLILHRGSVHWKLGSVSDNAANDRIRKAVHKIVQKAKAEQCSVSVPSENFARVQKESGVEGALRHIQANHYAEFHRALLRSACRAGVEVNQVQPNFSKAVGFVKFGIINSFSPGVAGAMMVARAGMFGQSIQTPKSAAPGKHRRSAGRKKYFERVVFPRPMPVIELECIENRPRGSEWKKLAQVLGPDESQWRAMLFGLPVQAARPRPCRGRKVSPDAGDGKRTARGAREVTEASLTVADPHGGPVSCDSCIAIENPDRSP